VSDDHYKIPIAIRNKHNMVADQATASKVAQRVPGIINSVENFQMIQNQNVLQQPQMLNGRSSSTTTTTPTSVAKNQQQQQAVPSSHILPSSAKTSPRMKPLPKGVLPIPDLGKNEDDNSINEIHGAGGGDAAAKDDKKLDETLGKPVAGNDEVNEQENGAHEINDNNDFNIEEKSALNHMQQQDNLDNQDEKNMEDKNMAAEEFDGHKPVDNTNNNNIINKKTYGNDEMDLEIINRPVNGGVGKDKLNEEIAADHGKEPDGYPDEMEEDLHIDGQQEHDEPDDLGDGEFALH